MTEIPREFPLPRAAFERQRSLLGAHIEAWPPPTRRVRRRLVVVAVAVLVVVVAAASAFAVRDLLFGGAPSAGGISPTWSPDGRRFSFMTVDCAHWPACVGSWEVWTMNVDGTGRKNLTRLWGRELFPVWSPDWRRVVYVVNPCSRVSNAACTGTTQIYRMNADGNGVRRLARGVRYHQTLGQRDSGYDASPTWSPDGRKIAFVSDRTGSAEVYVMNADGSGQQRLTRHAKPGGPTWSPDGRMLAFVSHARGGPHDLYVVNTNGTGLLNLTPGPGGGDALSWSPDGRKIGFRSLRDGSGEIYLVNVDGTGLRRLTHLTRNPLSSGFTTFSAPVWSPDGRKILFDRLKWGTSNSEIVGMDADGSRQRKLTRNPAPDGDPVWSPDGKRILFVSKRDGYGEIYVMNADGTGQRNLTRLRGN